MHGVELTLLNHTQNFSDITKFISDFKILQLALSKKSDLLRTAD